MLDFQRVLSNLSEVVSEHARHAASSSGDSSSSDSESEPAPPAAKQRKAAAAKPSSSSSSDDSSSEEEAAAPRRVRAATHLGRFKKREQAKMVKGYSEHDLAAILGGSDPFAAAAAAVGEVRAQPGGRAASSSGYDSGSEPSGDEQQQQQRRGKAKAGGGGAEPPAGAAQQPMIVVRRPMPASARPPAPPTPQESRQPGWWQVCFHRAAGPGGVGAGPPGQAPAAITIHGFSEQDQTNLYNLAHVSPLVPGSSAAPGLQQLSCVPALPRCVPAHAPLSRAPATHALACPAQSLPAGQGHAGARGPGPLLHAQEGGGGAVGGQAHPHRKQRQRRGRGRGGRGRLGAAGGARGGPCPRRAWSWSGRRGWSSSCPPASGNLLATLPDGCAAEPAPGGAAAQQPADAQQQQQQQQPEGKAGKKGKKAKKAALAAAAAATAPAPAPPAPPAIKWKKAVGAALKASGKFKMKLSKLHRAVAKEAGLPKAQRAAALDALTAYLQSPSSKFALKDGVVRAA